MIGAGVATSRAGSFFGITIGTGPAYYGGECRNSWAQPAYAPAYVAPDYQYAPAPYGYYGINDPYYRYREHQDLHQELRAEHQDSHQELETQHWAEHERLNAEAAAGVPWWELELQHRAEHRDLAVQHWAQHEHLRDEHAQGHDELRW